MANIIFTIKTPNTPNFVAIQFSDKEEKYIPVGDLSEEQIDDLAECWKMAMKEKAEKQRKLASE